MACSLTAEPQPPCPFLEPRLPGAPSTHHSVAPRPFQKRLPSQGQLLESASPLGPLDPRAPASRTPGEILSWSQVSLPLWLSPPLSQQAQNSPSCQRASISAELGAGLAGPPGHPRSWAAGEGGGCMHAHPPAWQLPPSQRAQLSPPVGQGLESRLQTQEQHSLTRPPGHSVPHSRDLQLSHPQGTQDGPPPLPALCLLTCLYGGSRRTPRPGAQMVGQRPPGLTSLLWPRTDTAPTQQPALRPVLRLDGDERTGRRCQLEKAGPALHPAPTWLAQPSSKIAWCHCPGLGFSPGPTEAKGRGSGLPGGGGGPHLQQ